MILKMMLWPQSILKMPTHFQEWAIMVMQHYIMAQRVLLMQTLQRERTIKAFNNIMV